MPDEKQGLQPVDLNDLSLATEPLGEEFNADADAFSMPPPPDDGVHRVRLGYGSNAIRGGYDKNNKYMLMAHLQLAPVDERGWAAFDHVGSSVFNGKCKMAGVIKAATGHPAQAKDVVSLGKELDALVRAEKIVKIETRWEASCSHGETDPKTGKEKYYTIKSGQTKFPKLAAATNGTVRYNPEIECPKCHAVVSAQARILKYLNDGGAAAGQAQVATASMDENPFAS